MLRKFGGSRHSSGMSDGVRPCVPWSAGFIFPGISLNFSGL